MKRQRTIGTLVLVALAATVILSGCGTTVVSGPGAVQHTVTASGTGTEHAAPDQADMSFGVSVTNANAKKALDGASQGVTKITDAMAKSGIAKEDVQTQNVSVYPNYDYSSSKQKITGYTANITVTVTVRDLAKLGDVIAAANDAGADNIQGPSFTLSDDSDTYGKAIEKAVADARKRAEGMAKAAGKSLGAVVSITESSVVSPGPVYDLAGGRSAAESVPIATGQLDVVANVTVVFELK